MISQNFIDEVQARTDIVEVISSYIPLKKTGRNFKAVCPFHSEKTPSFIVSPQKQIFHCFGCGEGGGVLHFLMLYEKITFREAVEFLAARCGMKMPDQPASFREQSKSGLYDAVKQAADFFADNLKNRPQAKAAREYLYRRDVKDETIEQFQLGLSLSSAPLMEYMRKKGVRLEILEQASLIVPRRSGGYSDMFRDRIMFPIYDPRKRVVGFGGRMIRDRENSPKYINSLENPLYSKREQVYGLHLAKEDIVKKNSVFVVEGYLDMIIPFVRGIRNIVASLGTALTNEQIRLIKRYTVNAVLVYDADTAGQTANLRALDLLLEQGLNISVVRLPQGHDPDSLVREKGPEALMALQEKALDFFDYKTLLLAESFKRDTIEGKTRIAQEMLKTIDKIGSEVEKFEYIKRLSSYLSVREEVLLLEMRKLCSKKRRKFSSVQDAPVIPVPITEKRIVQFMLSNKKVMSLVMKNLEPEDLTHPLTRKTVALLFDKFTDNKEWSISAVLSMIEDKEISRFASELSMEEGVSLNKDLLRECLLKLRGRRVKKMKNSLQKQLREAEARNDQEKIKELIIKYRAVSSEVEQNG